MEHVSDVLGIVVTELNNRKGSWRSLAKKAGVSYSFVAHIASGHTPDPRISGVQKVYDVLKDTEGDSSQTV